MRNGRVTLGIGLALVVLLLATGAYFLSRSTSPGSEADSDSKPDTELVDTNDPEFRRCSDLVMEIDENSDCDKKWSVFTERFKGCEVFAPSSVTPESPSSVTFRDVVLRIGDCFVAKKENQKAIAAYRAGLQFNDWAQEDLIGSMSAHFNIKTELELLLPPENPKCHDLTSFENTVQNFVAKKDPKVLKELIYSENTLLLFVMESDAGGPISFSDLSSNLAKSMNSSSVSYTGQAGKTHCYVTQGWSEEYSPWKAFCAEQKGDKGCYYLIRTYQGIADTLPQLSTDLHHPGDGHDH